MNRKNSENQSRKKGQGLVEFAFVFPIFILILMAIFDFGRAFHIYSSLENMVHSAARVAVIRTDPYNYAGQYTSTTHSSLSAVQDTFMFYKSPLMTSLSTTTMNTYVQYNGVGTTDTAVSIVASYPVDLWFPVFNALLFQKDATGVHKSSVVASQTTGTLVIYAVATEDKE
ncbi:MAG: pilus assembly protein [Candidatus Riflebacteria bacterium]|nr:pilus assembly protein [Candidatus Riflebacteria bacterium]